MTVFTEGRHTAEFLVSEANGHRSREQAVIAAGVDMSAGAVLGKLTSSGKYKALTPGASDGSQTAAAILYVNTKSAAADVRATIIARDAEINGAHIVWPAGISTNNKTSAVSALAALGIIVR